MSFIYWKSEKDVCLEHYTLILPAIAVGNVGQLATDLLLNNIEAKCVAYLHHPCFLPIAGPDPFDPDSKKLSTSCQMFEYKEKKLVIIQHRAPLVNGKIAEYLNFLVSFMKEQKIKRTIMLSSSFSQFFTFEQLQNVPLHYLCAENQGDETLFQDLHWKKFNLSLPHTSKIPGGGITERFLQKCANENLPLTVLIMVCSEGDNYGDAHQMVSNLNKWLNIKEGDPASIRWKMPFSWNYPYANEPPSGIY